MSENQMRRIHFRIQRSQWRSAADTFEKESHESPVVLNGLEKLFRTKEFTDCEFLVGNNETSFKAHKLVLAMASEVFEEQLYRETSVMPILVPDVDPHIFGQLLRYIYLNVLPSTIEMDDDLDRELEIVKLWYASSKYYLHDLNKKYYEMIKINLKTCSLVYVLARRCDREDGNSNRSTLISKCQKVFTVKTPEILAENNPKYSYCQIPHTFLKYLFANEFMSIDSELDLFQALVRYANENGWDSNDQYLLDKDQYGKELLTPSQKSIREAMKQIRFLTMTLKEFDTVPAKSGLFTDFEVKAIRDSIAEAKPNIDFLKIGFSKERSKRYEHLEMKIEAPPCHDKDKETHSFSVPFPRTTLGNTIKFASKDFVWRIIIYMRTVTRRQKEYTVYLKCDSPEFETWRCYAQLDMAIVVPCSNGPTDKRTVFENIPWYCFKCDAKYSQTKPIKFDCDVTTVKMELVISPHHVSTKSQQSNVAPTYGKNMPDYE